MTQENKELLFKDLCARLPYDVAIDCRDEDSRFTCYLTTDILREIQNNTYYWEYKPCLFPMSSITSKQKAELSMLVVGVEDIFKSFLIEMEFYHKYHFDYRNLIDKNLAIDCTNLNIY